MLSLDRARTLNYFQLNRSETTNQLRLWLNGKTDVQLLEVPGEIHAVYDQWTSRDHFIVGDNYYFIPQVSQVPPRTHFQNSIRLSPHHLQFLISPFLSTILLFIVCFFKSHLNDNLHQLLHTSTTSFSFVTQENDRSYYPWFPIGFL